MGTFTHPITLYSASGERSETLEALVDTGSTFSSVPTPVLEVRQSVDPVEPRLVPVAGYWL